MSSITAPPWIFDLEGTFLGFHGDDPSSHRIVLDIDCEQVSIALPEQLRSAMDEAPRQPGDRVRCVGRTQLDLDTNTVDFEAYQLYFHAPTAAPAAPEVEAIVDVGAAEVSSKKKAKKPVKILLCRKSGCRKRGGKTLVEALEQALAERHLGDLVKIEFTGCQKRCSKAPALTIMPGKHRYDRMSAKDVPALLDKHL